MARNPCNRGLPRHSYPTYPLLCVIILAMTLTSCRGKGLLHTLPAFRPPTLEAATTPLPTFPPESYLDPTPGGLPLPTLVPACQNNLTYIEDLSIPDGTQVTPGTQLDKRWRVKNTGTCNWDQRYQLKEIAGPELGALSEQRLVPARSGSDATIRIVFMAPGEAGTYRSAWQAYDPEDRPFGDPIFIEVLVQP